MRIEKLVLNNFGVYRDEHYIELSPSEDSKPIVLIGGLNGGGKTTLLDAIQLVLFGKLSKCSNRGNLPYEEYLRRCITRGADPKVGSFVELHFSNYVDGELNEYVIARSWTATKSKVRENFIVCKNGEDDPILSENWLDQVDQFLPIGLAELFFFDGEKIACLAESESAAEMLSTAINTLLGIDLVDKLEKDLETYEKDIRDKGKEHCSNKQIKELENEIDKLSKGLHISSQNKGSILVLLERATVALAKAEEEYRKIGGELFDRRKELESALRELTEQEANLLDKLKTAAAGEIPLLIVGDLIRKVREQSKKENLAIKQKLLLNELELRDQRILKQLDENEVSSMARVTLENLFRSDIEKRRKDSDIKETLGLSQFTHEYLESFPKDFSRQKFSIKKDLADLALVRERIAIFKDNLDRVPDEGAVANQGKKLSDAKTNVLLREGELSAAEEKISQESKELQTKELALKKALEGQLALEKDGRILTRKLKFAAKTRATMREFKQVILRRKVEQIQKEILICFSQLMRKKALIREIEIDPESYRMTLYGHDSREPILPERLSAGERQLLAVSTLWGLARVSGRPLPNIIDTPLGRLDSKHRANLVDNYFPFSSHQVIILSTDEEINKGYFEKLKRQVGLSYELRYSEETNSTEVEQGYFFR